MALCRNGDYIYMLLSLRFAVAFTVTLTNNHGISESVCW